MRIFQKISYLFGLFAIVATAQKTPESPSEIVTSKIGKATITIKYSSPSVKGRSIWGELVPFDQVWRAGANNATTFETDQDLQIEGQKLSKGKYTFFVIPNAKESTMIFNKVQEQWGAYKYDEKQDALRIKITPKAGTETLENLVYVIAANEVSLKWEKWSFDMSVK